MSLTSLARKTVTIVTKAEQKVVKGGNTDWIIISDTTIV